MNSDSEDEHFTPDHFNVCIKIIEGKDIRDPNVSSLVAVQVGEQKRLTKIVKNTNRPYFDEYFVFDVFTRFDNFMNMIITLSIFRPRKRLIRLKRLIGCISFDIGIIWYQPDHKIQNWLPVSLPSDPEATTQGLIKCEIGIEVPEKYRKVQDLYLLDTPDMVVGKKVRYMIKMYRCVGLKHHGLRVEAPDIVIKVLIAGRQCSTTKRKLGVTVQWCEQLMFIGMYPPLFHKIVVSLVVDNNTLSSKQFKLFEMLKYARKDDPNIFTFGPSYVHFYSNKFKYCGSLLMSIEIDGRSGFRQSEKLYSISVLPIEPITREKYGTDDNFLCYGVLFDAMIRGLKFRGRNINLSLDFGFSVNIVEKTMHNSEEKTNRSEQTINKPETENMKAIQGNSDFVHLDINEKKPCVFIRSDWPDHCNRLFNSNMLSNLASSLREKINHAQDLIVMGSSLEARNVLNSAVDIFTKDCQIIAQSLRGSADLDHRRIQYMSKFLRKTLPNLASSSLKEKSLEIVLKKLNSLLQNLDVLCEDIQEALPFVVLSLKNNKTVIGYNKLHPRHIMFSRKDKKTGNSSGKILSLFLKTTQGIIVGRLDIWLWLGYWDEVSYCLNLLPPGHEDITKAVSLPTSVSYLTSNIYTVICRIVSGCIEKESDSKGPCDTTVKVLIHHKSSETALIKKTLAPIWKETLVLPDIQLYSDFDYIKKNPPSITLELLDHTAMPPSLIGIDLIKPCFRNIDISQEIDFNLKWIKIKPKSQILCAFEIFQINNVTGSPFDIRRLSGIIASVTEPFTIPYRLEVVFWGIRPTSIRGFRKKFNKIKAIMQCSTCELRSSIIDQTDTSLNFIHNQQTTQLDLPGIHILSPPLVLSVMSSNDYVGFAIEKDIFTFECKLPTKTEWLALNFQRRSLIERAKSRRTLSEDSMPDLIPLIEIDPKDRSSVEGERGLKLNYLLRKAFNRLWDLFTLHVTETLSKRNLFVPLIIENLETDEHDWWFLYYSGKILIYPAELEREKEFGYFNDVLRTFIIKQHKIGSSQKIMKVKALMCLYKWPSNQVLVSMEGQDPGVGVLKMSDLREKVKLLVRVYCIRAHNLHPSDPNGLADPYLEIANESNCTSDKYNYIPKQLNPIFGKCLEITATLPIDSILTIRVKDWDMLTASDLLGETTIDIENRFYSKHNALGGLPLTYSKSEFNTWRHNEMPTEILERLCNFYNIALPKYYESSVIVGSKEFVINTYEENEDVNRENLALKALNHWKEIPIVGRPLVPQHVETRSLYLPDKPGVERGKLEMWVDILDLSKGDIPAPLEIKPREPKPYELRVVILNTAKVPLVDSAVFVGKKHSDIYVKGWLWDPKDAQNTDIHYTSINGIGNFNWRFIFTFLYHRSERRIVVRNKDMFSIGISEKKYPPLLHLQVWDSDTFSEDDFIGAMVLDLCRMPRGAISVKTCRLKQFINPSFTIDLFKMKHLKGWWPFFQTSSAAEPKSAGFLEAEFHLYTAEEALIKPAGIGRGEPNALPPPIRPDFKIKFWLAPFRALLFFCGLHKGKICACGFISGLVLFILLGIYSLPVFIIKKILGA